MLIYKTIIFTFFVLISFQVSYSQVKIGTAATAPDSSALLELESNNKGFLTPRLTTEERNAISNPANGLLVYDTDLKMFYYYESNHWVAVGDATSALVFNNISSRTCIGDSLHLLVHPDLLNVCDWVTPSGNILLTVSGAVYVDTVGFTSGFYRCDCGSGLNVISTNHFVNIDKCPVEVKDDFIVLKDSLSSYSVLENDKDNNAILKITAINGISVQPQHTVATTDGLFVIKLLDNYELQILAITDTQVVSQITYEVEDITKFKSTGKATIWSSRATLLPSMQKSELYSIIAAAQEFDTIDLKGKIILVKDNPLDLEKSITLKNGIIKRACTPVSTVVDTIWPNTNWVRVDDPSKFAMADWTLPVSGPSVDQNSGGEIMSISAINNDTIFTYQNHLNMVLPGAKLIKKFPLIRMNGLPGTSITLDNMLIDGNKRCNNYTYDWKYNITTVMSDMDTIRNSTFINTPTENVFMCGGQLENCRAFNLNGSFAHGSCSNYIPITNIINNYVNGVCLAPHEMNGHNEGCFTYSSNVQNFYIANNTFINGKEACWGAMGLDDYNNTLQNNMFKNFMSKVFFIEPSHPNPDITINNLYFNIQE